MTPTDQREEEYNRILKGYAKKEAERIICPICGYKYTKYLHNCPNCIEKEMKQ